MPLNSRANGWLRKLFFEKEERTCSGEALKVARDTLAAFAQFSGKERELHTRAAWHEGALYFALGPKRIIQVDASGWRWCQNPPVLFRRFPNLKSLPDPQEGGSIRDIVKYVNLKSDRGKRLFMVYATTCPLPHVGRPICNVTGPMGSGKTTLGRLQKRLIDPTVPEAVRLDLRGFLQKASHSFVMMLDNQTGLLDWAADSICRLVTGEADSKRRLYTDDEDVIYALRRAVLLNGINVPTDPT